MSAPEDSELTPEQLAELDRNFKVALEATVAEMRAAGATEERIAKKAGGFALLEMVRRDRLKGRAEIGQDPRAALSTEQIDAIANERGEVLRFGEHLAVHLSIEAVHEAHGSKCPKCGEVWDRETGRWRSHPRTTSGLPQSPAATQEQSPSFERGKSAAGEPDSW